MTRKVRVLWTLTLAAFVSPAAHGEDLVTEALSSFPPQTARLEYTNAAALRRLPNYASLKTRYTGPNLQKLEADLAKLGIREEDISEIVLGWQPTGGGLKLEGLAAGHFDPEGVRRRAASQGLASSPVEGQPAYCFGAEADSACLVVLSQALGAFGELSSLDQLVLAREGQSPNLSANDTFTKLVDEGRKTAPIWGVAAGSPAVVDWFKGWMPGQSNLQLDWASAFKNVESVNYSVEPASDVRLDIKLNCTTPAAASSLRQVFDGLKIFQQLAWQQQNPGVPNPFQNLAIGARNRNLLLTLTTGYDALEKGIAAP